MMEITRKTFQIIAQIYALTLLCAPATGAQTPQITMQWKQHFSFGPAGARVAVDPDGAVFVGDDTGSVVRLNAESGTEAWRYESGARVRSAPITWNGLVLFGNGAGKIIALNRQDGQEQWTTETGDEILGRVRIAGEVVHAPSTDGYLYALYAWDGNIIWRYNMGEPASTRPALGGGMVICTADRGKAAGLAPGERRVAWEYISGTSPLSDPLIVGQTVVFAADRGVLYGIDLQSGTYQWKYAAGAPIPHGLAVSGDVLFFGTADGAVTAWDISSQKALWTVTPSQGPDRTTTGAPLMAHGVVMIPFNKGELFALDPASGETLWTYREDVLAPGAFADLSSEGDWIAAPNDNGYLYLFRITGGTMANVAEAHHGGDVNTGDVQQLLERAKAAFLSGDYDEAAANYRLVIERDPENVKAYYNLAVALEFVGGERYATPIVLHEAARHYERALDIDPAFQPARINLGILYSKLGDNNRAAEVLRQALDAGDDKNVRYNLAVVLEKLKRYSEARAQWEAYLVLETDSDQKAAIRTHIKSLPEDKPAGE